MYVYTYMPTYVQLEGRSDDPGLGVSQVSIGRVILLYRPIAGQFPQKSLA
jgi:hypothetical protein